MQVKVSGCGKAHSRLHAYPASGEMQITGTLKSQERGVSFIVARICITTVPSPSHMPTDWVLSMQPKCLTPVL